MFIKKRYLLFLFLLFLFSFSLSCKKEEEAVKPVISVTKPYPKQIFSVFDTVHVVAEITHVKNLENISLTLLNKEMVPVTNRFNLTPTGKTYTLDNFIVIDDIELSSGSYYVQIKASDGKGHTNSFTEIYLFKAPLYFKKALIIGKTTALMTSITTMDNSLQDTVIGVINTDFGYSGYEPIENKLYISGKYSSSLFCFDYNNAETVWSVQVPGFSPNPYFKHLLITDKKVYLALRNQAVIAYNSSGTQIYNLPIQNNLYPEHLFIHNNFLVTSQRSLSSSDRYIVIYFLSSSGFAQQLQTNINPVGIFPKSDNEVFIFGNDNNGHAVLKIYEYESNNMWQPYNMPSEELRHVVRVDENTFLLAFNNRIERYTYQPNSMTAFVSNISVAAMAYDTENEVLWTGTTANEVRIYGYPFGGLQNQQFVNATIKDIILIYNK